MKKVGCMEKRISFYRLILISPKFPFCSSLVVSRMKTSCEQGIAKLIPPSFQLILRDPRPA